VKGEDSSTRFLLSESVLSRHVVALKGIEQQAEMDPTTQGSFSQSESFLFERAMPN
jgi:hypothetical protein